MKHPTPKQAYRLARAEETRAYQAMFENWTSENKAAFNVACRAAYAAYWAAYPKTPPATGQKVKA